ncbi:hypothetical protein FGG78_34790, partial [Thioclava sp. BHET1]
MPPFRRIRWARLSNSICRWPPPPSFRVSGDSMGVWVDTDMGFDDLVSLLVLEHMNERVEGMSLVFGNAPLAQVARNVAGARAAFGWHMPVYMGAARPILGQAPSAVDVLGETG